MPSTAYHARHGCGGASRSIGIHAESRNGVELMAATDHQLPYKSFLLQAGRTCNDDCSPNLHVLHYLRASGIVAYIHIGVDVVRLESRLGAVMATIIGLLLLLPCSTISYSV